MTKRIENLLIYTLEQAAQMVANARNDLALCEREVEEVTALLADHRRRNAPLADTAAFAVQPPASPPPADLPTCFGCGAEIYQRDGYWHDSVGSTVCPNTSNRHVPAEAPVTLPDGPDQPAPSASDPSGAHQVVTDPQDTIRTDQTTKDA